MSQTAAQRREIHYSGRVQGVGFRYTVRSLAARTEVTGFVRNLRDGRVELVVEGSPEQIERLLAGIQSELGRYVANAQESTAAASGEFEGFDIRF